MIGHIIRMRRRGSRSHLFGGALIIVVAASWGWGSTVHGQGIGLPGQSGDKPIEINAEDGIEWQQESKAYIARGNARAQQGDVTIHADMLTAFYREIPNRGSEIWRIDADRKVRIISPTQTSYGDKAVYDVAAGVLVMTGKVRLVTATDRITARDSLEFWEKRELAVARGDAIAMRGENRLRADILTAHFSKDKNGKSRMSRIDAFDNVLVSSPGEIARGDQGVYNIDTGIAVLTGSVSITRGDNQLNGEYAEVNLNTGVSRLFGGAKQGVKGYFMPRDVRKKGGAKRNRGKAAR